MFVIDSSEIEGARHRGAPTVCHDSVGLLLTPAWTPALCCVSLTGVAKRATVYAVRVFGCKGTGAGAAVLTGIEWVLNHAITVRESRDDNSKLIASCLRERGQRYLRVVAGPSALVLAYSQTALHHCTMV